MPCVDCKFFSPVRLASMANSTIQRLGPGPDCDFRFNPPPMTQQDFDRTITWYQCEKWEQKGGEK